MVLIATADLDLCHKSYAPDDLYTTNFPTEASRGEVAPPQRQHREPLVTLITALPCPTTSIAGLNSTRDRSRWKSGLSLHEIGRAYGKPHNSIRCLLLPRGGIPPAARRRSCVALTLVDREDTSRRIASVRRFVR